MPRTKNSSGKVRHDPLLVQLDEDKQEEKYGHLSQPGKRKKSKHSSTKDEASGEVPSFTMSACSMLELSLGYSRCKNIETDF